MNRAQRRAAAKVAATDKLIAIPPKSLERMRALQAQIQQIGGILQHEIDACAAALGIEAEYGFDLDAGVIRPPRSQPEQAAQEPEAEQQQAA